jgi:hypothetical protein
MPKKKTEPLKEFALKFTGKMSILIELEDTGPMQFRVDDIDVALEVARLILKHTQHTMTVDSYNKREETTFKKLLDF